MDSALGDDITHRLDPALRHLLGTRTDLSLEMLGAVRESLNQRRRETAEAVDMSGVDVEDENIRIDAAQSVRVRIYRVSESPAPAVIYCHSGAFVLGNLDTVSAWNSRAAGAAP